MLDSNLAQIQIIGEIMTKFMLQEYLNPVQSKSTLVIEDTSSGKNLYLKGIFIQGDIRNQNQRIYPQHEIKKAVETMNEQIKGFGGILGEVDHPTNLRINLDRVSHMITSMWMEGSAGCGKLKILPTPMGNLVRSMLEAGVQLGVSSRGSGNVNESSGHVSDFEIVTVDIVAQPSAPDAYPKVVYESLMNMRGGHRVLEMAAELNHDPRIQKYMTETIKRFINELKI